jgi:DNA modification methylase
LITCGDARDPEVIARVLLGKKAQMVFTDPPYNIPIDGHAAGIQQNSYREFSMASGEMTPEQYSGFLNKALETLNASCAPGAIIFVSIDWRHLQPLLVNGEAIGLELKNVCVWAKTNFGMGSFYRSQTEHVVVFKVPGADHIRNFGPETNWRNRTNLWSYAGMNGFNRGRTEALATHPTVKPVALVADAIRDCSKRGGIILDAFAGSGTTLVAAHRTGRQGRGVEIDPHYVDAIVRGLEKETGEEAARDDSVTFAEARDLATRSEGA